MLARLILIAGLIAVIPLSAAEPPITAAAFAPDGTAIVVGSRSGLRVYTWPELVQRQTLATDMAHIHDVSFAPDGETVAVVGGQPAEEGSIELFTWPAAKRLAQRSIGEDLLYRVAWHFDGTTLVVAGPDRGIRQLDRNGQSAHQIEGHSRDVVTVAFLPDGHVLSGSRDSTIRIWKPASNELLRTLNNHTNEIHDIAVRPRSTKPPYVLASSSVDGTVRFWWPVRGRLMRFAKLPSPALDIEWTPDGAQILAACADGHVRSIDPDTVQITSDIEIGPQWLYTIAIAPDGTSAFVGGEGGLMQRVKID